MCPQAEKRENMTKAKHNGRRKASALGKTRAERSAHVMNPEYLAVIENFRLMDDTFMSKCLENAPECIELILQIILGKKDLKVVKSQTEYPIKSLQGRGVRFDVFARDSEGKEYDIEIQRADKGAEPKRARYNSALLDANALKSGEDFDKLRDAYVIFITENDVMKRGKDAYSYQRREDDTGECLGDGTHIIYVNGATHSKSDIGKLMHDFLCRNAAEMYFDLLKRQVSQFKNSEEGRRIMCKAVEEFAERRAAESEARGKREGKRENMLATAKRMLKDGILALKDVARYTGLSLAQVTQLKASM
jgi:predicted transposase/invertase (TIGR01784 family)